MQPGGFTELFFLDEAIAWAAGHRPCALCRREDYLRFLAAWKRLHPGDRGANAVDARLHGERLLPGGRDRRLHEAPFDALPDGAFVVDDGAPWLVLGGELLRWTPAGYGDRRPWPASERATVITPPSLLAVLSDGWSGAVPLLHPSAWA